MKYKEQVEDFVAAGFQQLDDHLVHANPPRISWGDIYRGWNDEDKVRHLEKLASTMNHAAALIQDERNQLNTLLELKEKQIESMKESLEQNNAMIQDQIQSLNAERQQYNAAFAKVNAELREYKKH